MPAGGCRYAPGVNELLIGLLSAMVSTNPVVAASNALAQTTGIRAPVVDTNDPAEREYRQLLERDDAAQTEADEWIREAGEKDAAGDDLAAITLNARVKQRFEPVEQGYADFLRRYPGHTRARLAYGSMLSDFGRHDEAVAQWEKARELDPANPATWNNLADHFSHFGPARKCLEYFAKAVELNPKEPLYRHNLATAVFVFRADAREVYGLADDQAVLRKALELYRDARTAAPNDFKTATDLAQVYYYLSPTAAADEAARGRATEALVREGLAAWNEAGTLAPSDLEREGIALHMARFCGMHGRYDDGRKLLDKVTHPGLADIKARVKRGIEFKEQGSSPQGGGRPAPEGTRSDAKGESAR